MVVGRFCVFPGDDDVDRRPMVHVAPSADAQ